MSTHRLDAWSKGRRIGTLSYHDERGQFAFDYDAEWLAVETAFPLSPALPFPGPASSAPDLHSASVRRFFENLLPEGKALDDAVAAHKLSKANLYGLLAVLGRESTGAISLLPEGTEPGQVPVERRQLSTTELSERIRRRSHQPFNVWDGRVRMSIAGYQDKLAVYIDEGQLYLVEGKLASTHILKPEPLNPNLPLLVANEHFCLKLAAALGVSAAPANIQRVPEPVLVVERFDRRRHGDAVNRLHVIDACQALDLSVGHKYERNFGSGRDVAHIRDGVSLARLFALAEIAIAPAPMRLGLLRWTLLQYLLGNSDAHGKNVSFFVEPGGLRLAPSYDLVATCIYPEIDHELALAIGDEFELSKVRAYDWAEFAGQCALERRFMAREMSRMATRVRKVLRDLQNEPAYEPEELALIRNISDFVLAQADRIESAAKLLPQVEIHRVDRGD